MLKTVTLIILNLVSVSIYSQSKQIPTMNHEFKGKFNVVYSPSLEISWLNLRKSLVDSDNLMMSDPPNFLSYLNNFELDSSLVTNQNIFTYCGSVDHFKSDSLTQLISNSNFYRPYDFSQHVGSFISYAQIAFDFKWQGFIRSDLNSSIIFDNQLVHTIELNSKAENYREFARNIKIMDFQDENDFIIKIVLNDTELILAKVQMRQSIEETYSEVNERMKLGTKGLVTPLDSLKIPVLAFGLTKEFKELCNKRFLNEKIDNIQLDIVKQRIEFALNEKGVKMSSEAVDEIFGTSERQLKFDQPFLLILKKDKSSVPLLVSWISNTEFMTKH